VAGSDRDLSHPLAMQVPDGVAMNVHHPAHRFEIPPNRSNFGNTFAVQGLQPAVVEKAPEVQLFKIAALAGLFSGRANRDYNNVQR